MTSSTDTESRLAALWRDVLGINDQVGPEDDFFSIGGNSLGAIRLIFRIRETFNAEVTLRDFYTAPTLSDCARVIDTVRCSDTESPVQAIHRIDRGQPQVDPGGEG